jgi:uncharacterized protein YjbI with pentapeptide repeats
LNNWQLILLAAAMAKRSEQETAKKKALSPVNPISPVNRTVGIEIEVPERRLFFSREEEMVWNLRDEVDLHEDGSLHGQHSIEFVSPILSLGRVRQWVSYFFKRLETHQPEMNEEAGLHVHVGIEDFDGEQLGGLCLLLRFLENFLFQISGNRRNNRFCLPWTESEFQEILRLAQDKKSIERICAEQEERYRAFNLCAYDRHGTIEFRLHEGTLDPEEVIGWSRLCRDIVNHASTLSPSWSFPDDESPEELALRISSPCNRDWVQDKIFSLPGEREEEPEKKDSLATYHWDLSSRDPLCSAEEELLASQRRSRDVCLRQQLTSEPSGNFCGREISYADLSGIRLEICDFSRIQAEGVNFAGANLSFGHFAFANLKNANFSGANLEGCDFSGANLEGASFKRANLKNSYFWRTKAGDSNFCQANLTGTRFLSSNLDRALFIQATGERTSFIRTSLVGADFSSANLPRANFSLANITRGNLLRAQFNRSDFSNSDLTRSSLVNTVVTDCTFRGALFREVDFFMTIFSGSSISGANFEGCWVPPALLDGVDISEAIGLERSLALCSLTLDEG